MGAEGDLTEQFRATFFEECAELLKATEGHLADLAAERATDDTLHAVFRAVHSIKGGAGAFAYAVLPSYSHKSAMTQAAHAGLRALQT